MTETKEQLERKLAGINQELDQISQEQQELEPKVLGVLQRTMQQNLDLLEMQKHSSGMFSKVDINVALERSRMVRTKLAGMEEFSKELYELDIQIALLQSMAHESLATDAGAGKVRVCDEHRLARVPGTDIRDYPLRDQIEKLGGGRSESRQPVPPSLDPGLSDHAVNDVARDTIRSITGKPLIKAVEEILQTSFPDLMKAFYPRIYENVGRYASPRECAVMLANVIAESLRYSHTRTPTAYQMLMPGLTYMRERRMPMFFIAPDLLEAVLRTDFDDDIDWTELSLPYETGIMVLPKGALVHPEDGEVAMLVWSRMRPGDHPPAWLGLPQLTTAKHSFAILGACLGPMIWYDSIFTADVRRTVRLKNLFYREPGEAIPPVTKNAALDANLTEKDSDFIEKMGVVLFGTIMAMNARPQLVERGQRLKVVGKGDKAREFWSPNVIGARYKIKREVAKIVDRKFVVPEREHGTHASPRMHWRRGHYRNQAVGQGRKERKQIWIEPCLIGAGEDE